MIDLCLQRDPADRPSAEALMKHQFFKSAKKKAYIASVIQSIPPVHSVSKPDAQARAAAAASEEQTTTTTSWNFSESPSINSPEEEEDSADDKFASIALQKKSRFIVEGGGGSAASSAVGLASAPPSSAATPAVPADGATIKTVCSVESDVSVSEIKKGRFSVFESKAIPDEKPILTLDEANCVAPDIFIQKTSAKVGRFEIESNSGDSRNCSSAVGSKYTLVPNPTTASSKGYSTPGSHGSSETCVVLQKDLELLLESNNNMRQALDEIAKQEEEKLKNPLKLLKTLEESLKRNLAIKDTQP